jgi:hypothetical protein
MVVVLFYGASQNQPGKVVRSFMDRHLASEDDVITVARAPDDLSHHHHDCCHDGSFLGSLTASSSGLSPPRSEHPRQHLLL